MGLAKWRIDAGCAAQEACASYVLTIMISRAGSTSGLCGGSALKPFCPSLILKLYTSFPRAATGIQGRARFPPDFFMQQIYRS